MFVWLSDTHHGVVGPETRPQPLTSAGSGGFGATPATSETSGCTVYELSRPARALAAATTARTAAASTAAKRTIDDGIVWPTFLPPLPYTWRSRDRIQPPRTISPAGAARTTCASAGGPGSTTSGSVCSPNHAARRLPSSRTTILVIEAGAAAAERPG